MSNKIDLGWYYRNQPMVFDGDDYIAIEAFRAAVAAFDRGEDKIPPLPRNAHTATQAFLDFMINGIITRTRMPQ